MSDVHVVILAAGQGTRMKSALPKVLHKVAGRAMVDHVLRTAGALSPATVTLVVGHKAEIVESHIGREAGVSFALQQPQLGTAHALQQAEPVLAGKTGTAHKQEGRGYASHKYRASFVGLAPASNPRLVVAVMIDEPTSGGYYGGTVAAPVFSTVMSGALRLLGVKPDAPLNNVVLPPPNAPEVREEV